MSNKALIAFIPSIPIAFCVLCSMTLPRLEASAETAAGYPTVSTQLFDATPIGGDVHTFVATADTRSPANVELGVKAQIFDPEALGGTARSKFSGAKSIAANSE